jgi:hypothetical protein
MLYLLRQNRLWTRVGSIFWAAVQWRSDCKSNSKPFRPPDTPHLTGDILSFSFPVTYFFRVLIYCNISFVKLHVCFVFYAELHV